MATEKTAKPITLGEIECRQLVFTTGPGQTVFSGPDAQFYVVGADEMDLLAFWKGYSHTSKRCEVIGSEGSGKGWFAVAVQDCFDPPVCIVRADHETGAEWLFLSEKNWVDVSEPDLKDYEKDGDYPSLTYTDRGTWAETENIAVIPVKLLRAEF